MKIALKLSLCLRKSRRFLVAVEVKFCMRFIKLKAQLHISAALCCIESTARTGRDGEKGKLCVFPIQVDQHPVTVMTVVTPRLH